MNDIFMNYVVAVDHRSCLLMKYLLHDWVLEVLESRKKKHESLCVCVRILILIIVYGSRYNKIL